METGETLDAVIESDVQGIAVARAPSNGASADGQDVSQSSGRRPAPLRPFQRSSVPRERGGSRKRRRNRRFGIFAVLRRSWIPLVILVVIVGAGFTVTRLHSVFGSEKRPMYADTRINDAKPYNPKHMTYEVFGPPGTSPTSAISTSMPTRDESTGCACRGRWSSRAPRRRPWEVSWRKAIVTALAAASWWTVKSKPNKYRTK